MLLLQFKASNAFLRRNNIRFQTKSCYGCTIRHASCTSWEPPLLLIAATVCPPGALARALPKDNDSIPPQQLIEKRQVKRSIPVTSLGAATADSNETEAIEQPAAGLDEGSPDAAALKQISKATGLMIKQIVKLPRLKAVLLRLDTAVVKSRLRNLQQLLQLPNKRGAVEAACMQPALLEVTELELSARMQRLANALDMLAPPHAAPLPELASAASPTDMQASSSADTSPAADILHASPSSHAAHPAAPKASTSAACSQESLHPGSQAKKTNSSQQCLDACQLVCRHPDILARHTDYPSAVQALISIMEQSISSGGGGCTSTSASDESTSSTSTSSRGGAASTASGSTTAAAKAEVTRLIRRCPQLLVQRSGGDAAFAQVLQVLSAMLGIDAANTIALVRKEPSLLAVGPGPMRTAAEALTACLQLGPGMLHEMVLHVPELLCKPPGVVGVTCRRFLKLMTRSEVWREQLPKLAENPRNLAVAISFDTSRYDRLDYLVRTKRDAGCPFKQALTMSDADWEDMYPGYKAWWAKRGR